MKRDPGLTRGPAGGIRGRLSSEWAAFRARVPYLLRRLIITVLVLFVACAIPWTYFNIKYSGEVARELARLRAEGEPLTIEELIPKPVPDDQNAAVIYQQFFQVSFDPAKPQPEQKLVLSAFPREGYQQLVDSTQPGEEFDAELARRVLSTPEARAVLAKLEEASKLPHAVWPIYWEEGYAALFPQLAKFRDAARLLAARARLSAADGDTDDALRWTGVCLRMSRQVTEGPTLIDQLVAIAINAMACHAVEAVLNTATPSPEAVAELREVAAGIDFSVGFHRALQMERVFSLWLAEYIEREGGQGMERVLGDQTPPAMAAVYGSALAAPLRAFDEARLLAHWRTMLPEWDRPWRMQKRDATDEVLRSSSRFAVLPPLVLPALGRASQKRDMGIAMLDELQIVLDLKMHKRLHGVYPVRLEDLAGELPEDPFAGEAYRYERRGEGFALWSIGPDLEDDGGIPPEPESDLGWDEADIVWECAE